MLSPSVSVEVSWFGDIVAVLAKECSGAASAGCPWTTACSPSIMYLAGA